MNRTANPILYGMRIERRLDDDYFNFVTRLAKNQEKQRMIVFGEHLLNVSRFWLSVDFTCAPEKMIHSPYLNVQIEQRIDDRMLQCIVDTLDSSITRPMQLCVEPSQLMPEPAMENIEFTQIILEEAVTHLFPVYIQLVLISMCATLSAIFSGLTTGLMALSTDDLKVYKITVLQKT
ncbi:hypothetical protein WUBG_16141 [Wuchereria bancrofti]|uniref:CNNM transmembrane domain-containing protein n=1 Tax=Wuchereria bancrofti TaxID=6293 RepID=J9DTH5_WUCBA|nr:hypothetical protein WUBG_16141 [Wuchereria bancrofti]